MFLAISFSELEKYADPKDIDDSKGYLSKWKLLAPKAPIAGQTDFSKPVGFYYDGNTRIAAPGECCTESFIILGAFDSEDEVLAYRTYIYTKTVRFLLLRLLSLRTLLRRIFASFQISDIIRASTTIKCSVRNGISLRMNGK